MVSQAGNPHHAVRPVCHCLGVTEGEIRQAIEHGDLGTVWQVTHACSAGGGCTACHRHIKRFLHDHAQHRVPEHCHHHDVAGQPALGFA